MVNRWGNNGNSEKLYLGGGAPKSLQMVTVPIKIKRYLFLGRKAMTNLDSMLKNRDITLPFLSISQLSSSSISYTLPVFYLLSSCSFLVPPFPKFGGFGLSKPTFSLSLSRARQSALIPFSPLLPQYANYTSSKTSLTLSLVV